MTRDDLARAIRDLLTDRSRRVAAVAGAGPARALAAAADAAAANAADRLLGDAPDADTAAALLILAHGDSPPPAEWWGTTIGRAIARAVRCAPGETVTAAEAARMLGVSRQRAHRLLKLGRLERAPDGRVVLQSVLDRLARFELR